MGFSKKEWHKFAEKESDLRWTPGNVAEITVDGKQLCVARVQDQWFGFSHTCPHAAAPLSDGYVDRSRNIICPVHHLKFSLRPGRDTLGEGYKSRVYPVELRSDGLFIALDEGSFL